MKTHNIILGIAISTVLIFGGCYTVLMAPQEFAKIRQENVTVKADASYSLNYNQNCLSCHSRAELDERYLEWKYYGITTAHNGIILDPTAWNTPYASPGYEPDPYGWYNPVPSQPWWIPSATSVVGSGQSATKVETGNRVRETGSTRDSRETRERPQANTTPTQASPSQPVGGTTPTTSTNPPPATSVTTTPSTQQPTSNTGTTERSRTETKSDDSGSRTRSSGSSRDSNSGNRPR